MTKTNLTNKDIRWLICELESDILDLIDNRDEFTRSDLQGAVSILVVKILRRGQELGDDVKLPFQKAQTEL